MADRSRGPSRREALRITAVGGAALALGGGLGWEILRRARTHRVAETRVRMGTLVEITAIDADPARARSVVDAAFDELERLEAILSRHRAGTPLWRLNAEGRLARPPAELLDVLRPALALARETGGAFDPTVAPVLELHRASWEASGEPPPDAELGRARALVGWMDVDATTDRIELARPGMRLTLDGIAKGHVVDRTVAAMVGAGAERVLVNAGGDVAAAGAPGPADPWTIAIQDPERDGGALGVVSLEGAGVATSGDYLHAFSSDRSAHHVIDPRTGRSPTQTSAVTVRATTALEADALSTAAMVLGPAAGLALLRARPGVEGLIVTKGGRVHATPGFGGPARGATDGPAGGPAA